MPGAVDEATAFLAQHHETRSRFDRVAALVEGFESPAGLELLATVHWVMTHEAPLSLDDVVARTHAWHPRKRKFTARQVGIAVDVLSRQAWCGPLPSATENWPPPATAA